MGTLIELKVGPLTVSWNKNMVGFDYGFLYQEKHRKRIRSEGLDNDCSEENREDRSKQEMAFVCSLKEMIPRLDLTGHSLENIKRDYAVHSERYKDQLKEKDPEKEASVLSYEDFFRFVTEADIKNLDDELVFNFPQTINAFHGHFWECHDYHRIPYSEDADGCSEADYFVNLCLFLSPYSILRLLAENETNLSEDVIWHYGPLVEEGWAEESDFTPGGAGLGVLIVTEGSSDTRIIKHALSLLRPEVSDLFEFIDVDVSLPFSGTGNLVKFAEGLIRIGALKSLIFLFDNDAEGWEACEKIKNLNPPPNITAMTLPDQDSFRNFLTKGPSGIVPADINRRGAAIECYLDLEYNNKKQPLVIWKNFKERSNTYQGALESKEFYTKKFLKVKSTDIAEGKYNTDKISRVLDAIIAKKIEL